MDDKNRKVYRGLFLTNFFITLGFSISDPFFSVYALSKGATGLHLALVFSGYAAAKALVSPVSGWWSDRRGRRGLILCGLCIYSAISLGYLTLPGPLTLVWIRLLQGVAAAMVRPVSLALVGDIAPARKEGSAMGVFDISFYGALAIGPVIGGIIKDLAGFPGLFSVLAILCPLSLICALIFVRTPPKGAQRDVDLPRGGFSLLKRSAMLAGLSGFIFTRSFAITLFAIFAPVYMHESLGLTGVEIGMTMGAAAVVTALLLGPVGRLSDRVKRHRLVIIGGAMAALLTFCIPLARGFCPLFILCVAMGIFSAASLPASSALLVEEGNRHGMGLTMGIFNAAMNGAAVVAPLIGGMAFRFFGIGVLFCGAGIMGLLGIIFFSVCVQVAERRDKRAGNNTGHVRANLSLERRPCPQGHEAPVYVAP